METRNPQHKYNTRGNPKKSPGGPRQDKGPGPHKDPKYSGPHEVPRHKRKNGEYSIESVDSSSSISEQDMDT